MGELHPNFTLALALAAGVLAQSVARHARVPGIVVLLLVGVGLGPDGLGWIYPRSLGAGLGAALDIAVAVILFEGGLNLQIARLRREQIAIRRLVTWGALVTLVGACLAARTLLSWDWTLALLFGSLVVVTGPTVIGPLVGALRLKPRVATVLEAEGVLIDPVGALLAVLMLALVLGPDPDSAANAGRDLLVGLSFGTFAGLSGGLVLAGALRVRRLVPEGLENIFSLAFVLLLYAAAEQVIAHSGILAVTLAGAVVGNLPTPVSRELREFKDQLTVMLVGLLFVMLAADVRYEEVASLGLAGIGVVVALVLVVRPVGVFLSTLGSDLSTGERLFIAWVAPRGIVAAAIASLTAAALSAEGLPGGTELRAMVFMTIAGTVLLAGLTAGPVGTLLGVRLPGRETVAILGANQIALEMAQDLRDGGTPVVFIDTNPQNCRRAEEAGFTVVYGNGLEERTLQRARLQGARVALGATANQTVNAVFVNRARELFQVPQGLVSVERLDTGFAKELIGTEAADVAFDGAHDLGRWDVRARRGSVSIERWRFGAAAADDPDESVSSGGEDSFILLTLTRGEETQPMAMRLTPKEGDVAAIAIHDVDRAAAHSQLDALGWHPLPEEEVAEAATSDS